jgi:hypothetical protein
VGSFVERSFVAAAHMLSPYSAEHLKGTSSWTVMQRLHLMPFGFVLGGRNGQKTSQANRIE